MLILWSNLVWFFFGIIKIMYSCIHTFVPLFVSHRIPSRNPPAPRSSASVPCNLCPRCHGRSTIHISRTPWTTSWDQHSSLTRWRESSCFDLAVPSLGSGLEPSMRFKDQARFRSRSSFLFPTSVVELMSSIETKSVACSKHFTARLNFRRLCLNVVEATPRQQQTSDANTHTHTHTEGTKRRRRG